MPRPAQHRIDSLHAVGRYALGVTWGDRHESIYPFQNLRRLCPCSDCLESAAHEREPAEEARRLDGTGRLADASVVLHWADGHETLYLVEELRDICGCAACKGEPDYPITGQ